MDLIEDDGMEVIDGADVIVSEREDLTALDIEGMQQLIKAEMAKIMEFKRGLSMDMDNTYLILDILLKVLEGKMTLEQIDDNVMQWRGK